MCVNYTSGSNTPSIISTVSTMIPPDSSAMSRVIIPSFGSFVHSFVHLRAAYGRETEPGILSGGSVSRSERGVNRFGVESKHVRGLAPGQLTVNYGKG